MYAMSNTYVPAGVDANVYDPVSVFVCNNAGVLMYVCMQPCNYVVNCVVVYVKVRVCVGLCNHALVMVCKHMHACR